MSNRNKLTRKTFKQAVLATPDVATGFKSGLTALGKNSNKVHVNKTNLIQGSIDIDTCTIEKYPNANRWDYAFAYNTEVFFVEVHSAYSAEVSVVLNKLRWLKDWLRNHAPEIEKLKAKSIAPFYWIQSKGFDIPKTSPQYRAAVGAGLKPIGKLFLE